MSSKRSLTMAENKAIIEEYTGMKVAITVYYEKVYHTTADVVGFISEINENSIIIRRGYDIMSIPFIGKNHAIASIVAVQPEFDKNHVIYMNSNLPYIAGFSETTHSLDTHLDLAKAIYDQFSLEDAKAYLDKVVINTLQTLNNIKNSDMIHGNVDFEELKNSLSSHLNEEVIITSFNGQNLTMSSEYKRLIGVKPNGIMVSRYSIDSPEAADSYEKPFIELNKAIVSIKNINGQSVFINPLFEAKPANEIDLSTPAAVAYAYASLFGIDHIEALNNEYTNNLYDGFDNYVKADLVPTNVCSI